MAFVTIQGAELVAELDRLSGGEMFDLTDGLGEQLIGFVVRGIADHFHNEVDPDGVPWPVLSSDYARAKERLYPGRQILVREGELEQGIDSPPTVTVDNATYTFGTNEVQRQEAGWMQEGDPAANRPARRFIDLTPEAISDSDRLLDNHFQTRLK